MKCNVNQTFIFTWSTKKEGFYVAVAPKILSFKTILFLLCHQEQNIYQLLLLFMW